MSNQATEENGLQMRNSKKKIKIKRRSKTALKRLGLKWWMEISSPFHCYLESIEVQFQPNTET